jgi:CheY-like chemotaxis protein
VVWNLLSNAIKFTPRGGRVKLSASKSNEQLQLIVQDNGKGIAPEFLPRIFERFSQQDATSTRSHGGLGLGLALVKQLTDLHGGSIEAYSAGVGQGATFTVRLPLTDKPIDEQLSQSQVLRSMNLEGVIALVVEDDTDTRELIMRILTDAGARVVEAATADAALSCIESTPANVLISDIGMADQNGYELLRKLRARGHGAATLPAMALTAFARMQDRIEALAAGFQDHLVKPFEPQVLISRVAALRRDRASRSPR